MLSCCQSAACCRQLGRDAAPMHEAAIMQARHVRACVCAVRACCGVYVYNASGRRPCRVSRNPRWVCGVETGRTAVASSAALARSTCSAGRRLLQRLV